VGLVGVLLGRVDLVGVNILVGVGVVDLFRQQLPWHRREMYSHCRVGPSQRIQEQRSGRRWGQRTESGSW
jgi:hypothetical protein